MVGPRLSPPAFSVMAILTVAGLLSASVEPAFGADIVRVQTKNGRVFTGEVDAETDDDLLWLRSTAPSILVKSALRWSMISTISHAGRQLSIAEFRPVAEKLKSAAPADVFSPKEADPAAAPEAELNRGKAEPPRTVRSIRIQADSANWDADVPRDGLELWIIPVTADGSLLPVRGTLSVQLIGLDYTGHRPEFSEIGRWNQRVRVEDFDDLRGSLYRLPYRTVNPERDLSVGWYGIVHVRLSAPGHGSFEASCQVSVRTEGSVRDQLQLHHRRRFYPSERTAR